MTLNEQSNEFFVALIS